MPMYLSRLTRVWGESVFHARRVLEERSASSIRYVFVWYSTASGNLPWSRKRGMEVPGCGKHGLYWLISLVGRDILDERLLACHCLLQYMGYDQDLPRPENKVDRKPRRLVDSSNLAPRSSMTPWPPWRHGPPCQRRAGLARAGRRVRSYSDRDAWK